MSKLEGIIQAIEAEERRPLPSHSNLARLSAMAFRELMKEIDGTQKDSALAN